MLIQNLFLSLVASTAPVPGVEVVPPTEPQAIAEIVALIEKTVRDQASRDGRATRDAHAKHHGCVKAEVEVLPNLPSEYAVGVFKEPRSYPAWVRFSNGSGRSQDDSVGDGRGMAIKLMGVRGEKILEDEKDAETQDFLMINHPTFFVRDAADYVEFQRVLTEKGPEGLTAFFFPSLNPFRWRTAELGIVNAIRGKQVSSPLDLQYFSMAPYMHGPTRQMKYSARPCFGEPVAARLPREGSSFLRENMKAQLAESGRCFDFMIQLRGDPVRMPVEDPTVDWGQASGAPFPVTVAKIRIPAQDFAAPERDALCEGLSMTPWHSLPEHRPVGGINRVRKAVYQAVSRLRHGLNGAPRSEPSPEY